MKTQPCRRCAIWLAALVMVVSVLSALAWLLHGGAGGDLLDSRVTCQWLGPKACDPNTA
jgi:hypothetical protein